MKTLSEIRDMFGWAEGLGNVTRAGMELCETLDARLTALEAKPQETSVDWKQFASRAISENERLTDENKRLHDANDDLWVENVRFATERNALAAQLDDLRNVNAGLRKHDVYLDNLVKSLQSQIAADIDDIAGLRKENAELADLVTHLTSAMKNLQDAINGLREDNERQADDSVLAADVTHWRKRYQALQAALR